jgi:hypothetical protein
MCQLINIVIDGSNTEAGSTRDLTFCQTHGKNAYLLD